jgi:O-antigen ligase
LVFAPTSTSAPPSSRSELLAAPPLAAAALAVFYDGGYSGGSRVAFALAALAVAAVAFHGDRAGALRALRHPLALTLAALAALGAVSVLWTLGTEERTLRWAAVTAGYAAMFVGAAVAARTARGQAVLAAGIAVIAAAAAALGVAAVELEEPPYALWLGGDWRAAGPFEYPPALALLVVCALPAAVEAARSRNTALRSAGALGLALGVAVLVLAHSRVGLALGLGVIALAAYRATRSRALVVLGLAAAIAAGSLAFDSGDGPSSGFLHGREETWEAAVETFLDRPLLGAGADAFLVASARHQEGAAIDFAHDLPLEFAAELGIAGLGLALALYAFTALLAWRSRSTLAGWLFGPAAVAFLVANLLDWPWHLAGEGAIWALACGALAGTGVQASKAHGTA